MQIICFKNCITFSSFKGFKESTESFAAIIKRICVKKKHFLHGVEDENKVPPYVSYMNQKIYKT